LRYTQHISANEIAAYVNVLILYILHVYTLMLFISAISSFVMRNRK